MFMPNHAQPQPEMVSVESLDAGLLVAALGIPFLLFPETLAWIRNSQASDPTPTNGGVWSMRYVGVMLVAFGLIAVFAY